MSCDPQILAEMHGTTVVGNTEERTPDVIVPDTVMVKVCVIDTTVEFKTVAVVSTAVGPAVEVITTLP